MCASCGCGEPTERHPGAPSIVWQQIEAAAQDAGITPSEAVKNMADAVEQMTGHVVKADEEHRFLLMVGYSPNRLPHRGADGFQDVASPDVIEKACWKFMLNGHAAGLMHKAGGEGAFRIVENYVYRNPEPWTIKAADGSTQTIRQGDWLIGAILEPETWQAYKAGVYRGGSLQGGARRMEPRPETLARQRSA